MYWTPDSFANSTAAEDMIAMRQELRAIARDLRALSIGIVPRTPDLLADQIRAQIDRIQLPQAA